LALCIGSNLRLRFVLFWFNSEGSLFLDVGDA
jgi:hypothetical protein